MPEVEQSVESLKLMLEAERHKSDYLAGLVKESREQREPEVAQAISRFRSEMNVIRRNNANLKESLRKTKNKLADLRERRKMMAVAVKGGDLEEGENDLPPDFEERLAMVRQDRIRSEAVSPNSSVASQVAFHSAKLVELLESRRGRIDAEIFGSMVELKEVAEDVLSESGRKW